MKPERLLRKERIMPDISSALRRIPSLLSHMPHTIERKQSEGRRNPHKDRIEEGLSVIVLTHILTATAPSLQALSIAIHDPSIWASAFCECSRAIPSLPALRELSIPEPFVSRKISSQHSLFVTFNN